MSKIKEYFKKKKKEKEMKYIYEMVYNFDHLCEEYPGLKQLMRPVALRIWLDDLDEEEKKDYCVALIRSMGYEVREEKEEE